ncbi:hypothetical protein ACTMSW_26055 [Micromonospora sp. BQ11]|uniref:hypothetical protein n=1 Tax=Micromonospora sp. BQ11 TaxID=3452212 RepID=UPI003F8B95FF
MDRPTHTELRPADRLRIERAVWTLNAHLDNLPNRAKRARRRETRANLYAAAAEVGAAEAIRGLGDLRRLAAEYRTAEYGETGAQPSYSGAVVGLLLVQVAASAFMQGGTHAFVAGLLAAAPDATGTFQWSGIPYLTAPVTVTAVDGTQRTAGGAFTSLFYLLWLAAFVLGGRLWRLLPIWRRWRAGDAAAPAPGR